jgi:cytochrome c oxidase subunit 2
VTVVASTAPPARTVPAAVSETSFVVYFDTGSVTIRPDAAAVVAQAAARIPPGSSVVLTGFSDLRGDGQVNLDLSKRRAEAVRTALEKTGVKANFAVDARGAEAGSDLQQARRVEIRIS